MALDHPTRWLLNALRGIDSFVFALLFVASVGLGPFAGVLGIALHTWGSAAKFTHSDRLLALECLERVGLIDLALQRADTLSGAQQQRVAIARALAQQSQIILADEPIASLDPQ